MEFKNRSKTRTRASKRGYDNGWTYGADPERKEGHERDDRKQMLTEEKKRTANAKKPILDSEAV